jgi:hypothetical protein
MMTLIDIDLPQGELKLMIKRLKRYQLEELSLYFAFAYDIKNQAAAKYKFMMKQHEDLINKLLPLIKKAYPNYDGPTVFWPPDTEDCVDAAELERRIEDTLKRPSASSPIAAPQDQDRP